MTIITNALMLSIGKPGLTGIRWWINVETKHGPIFRLQLDDGTCPMAKYHRGWRRVV